MSLFVSVALISACGSGDDMAPSEDVVEVSAAATAEPTTTWGTAQTAWRQVGQGHTYTNWEQDVTVVEANAPMSAGISGDMVYGPHWQLEILRPINRPALFNFRMDSASDTQVPPGGSCHSAATYKSCRTPVGEEVVGKTIRLFLIKSNRTDGTDLWWSAWAQIQNGRGFYLGQLKTPYQGAIVSASSYTLAQGKADTRDPDHIVHCVEPPARTTDVFGVPTVSSPVLSPRTLPYGVSFLSGCYGKGSLAVPFYDGAIHLFGP